MSVVSRSRARPRAVVLAFALLVGLTAQAPTAWSASEAQAARARPKAISTDPYRNPDSQHRTQVEPSSVAAGSTIVSAFQTGRYFDGGASNIGFATSSDGGRTWRRGFLPRTTVFAAPAGRYGRASDPSVAYDARHRVWLISYLGLRRPAPRAPADVLVSRSTDGGLTWGLPVVVAATGRSLDKNWTTCDNTPKSRYYGRCYTQFDDNTRRNLMLLSTSTDGGAKWGAAVTPPGGANGLGGQPVVRPDGTVVVPYVSGGQYFLTISSFTSINGGASLTPSTVISAAVPHPSPGLRADLPLPSAQVDRSGKIYVVWKDCRFQPACSANDLVLSTSENGRTWSPVRRIPIDRVGSGVDHFLPGLGVDPSSRRSVGLGLTYYFYSKANCAPATCQLYVGFISSRNGGSTWSRRRVIAGPMRLAWLPATSQGRMVGDYIATTVNGRVANAVFALARAPSGRVFDQATYVSRLRITGGNQKLGTEAAQAPGARRGSRIAHAPTAR